MRSADHRLFKESQHSLNYNSTLAQVAIVQVIQVLASCTRSILACVRVCTFYQDNARSRKFSPAAAVICGDDAAANAYAASSTTYCKLHSNTHLMFLRPFLCLPRVERNVCFCSCFHCSYGSYGCGKISRCWTYAAIQPDLLPAKRNTIHSLPLHLIPNASGL